MMRPTASLVRTRPHQQATAIANEMVAKIRFLVGEFFEGIVALGVYRIGGGESTPFPLPNMPSLRCSVRSVRIGMFGSWVITMIV